MAIPRAYSPEKDREADTRKSHKGAVVRDTYRRLFGRSMQDEEFQQQIRAGFPVDVVDRLQAELDAPQATVLKLAHISPATLMRRRSKHGAARVKNAAAGRKIATKRAAPARLKPEESDRIFRIIGIIADADRLFEGDHDAAMRWLKEPAKALGGVTPLECLDTEAGTKMVRNLIGRLEYGVIT